MARNLLDALNQGLDNRAARRAPMSPLGAGASFGWSASELAARLGVSPRTARRYRATNVIPPHRLADFDREVRGEYERRQRDRIGRRGLSELKVQGRYRVSKSVYETHPDAPVKIMDGEHIPGATMREVFALEDAGDPAAANELLEQALSEAYGVGEGLSFERADSAEYTIR